MKKAILLLTVLLLIGLVHSVGLFRPSDYVQSQIIQIDFHTVVNESATIGLISYNFSPLISLGQVASNCSGIILSNGTSFNATHSWYSNFGVKDCNVNVTNSTIMIREANWNSISVENFTLYFQNNTALAGNDYSSFSNVFSSSIFGFSSLYNLTSGSGNYSDLANNLVTGLKSSTTAVTDMPYSYGVGFNAADVSWADNVNYKVSAGFTFICLVIPKPSGSYVMFLSHGKGAGTIGWEGRETPAGNVEFYGADLGSLVSSGTLTSNNLYYLTFVQNAATSRVYINTTFTQGSLNSVTYDSDNPICTGGQSYANSCHNFDPGEASNCYLIKSAESPNFVNATVKQSITYYGLGSSFISVTQPTNNNYTSSLIPYNVTPLIQAVNISINSSSCGNTTILNAQVGTSYTGTLNCSGRQNQYFYFNASDNNFNTLQTINQSFYIFYGVGFALVNGGNGTGFNNWILNVSNGTYTQNYSNQNNVLMIETDNLPLGSVLSYSFNPNNSLIFYPDNANLNGTFNSTNTSFANITGNAWFKQEFYLTNGSLQQNWTLNLTYNGNGTSASFPITSYFQTFSLQQFQGQQVTLNGLLFGFGNQSLTRTFNGSSPYLNNTFSVTIAGLNLSVFKEFTGNLINASWTLSNSSFGFNSTFVNTSLSQFVNYTVLPTGSNLLLQLSSPGFYPRQYSLTLDPFTILNLNAYLPEINALTFLVRFHIQSISQSAVSGATVMIQRNFNGNWFTVGSVQSDDTGTASFYMDSSQFYQVIVSFNGITATKQLFPTSSDYIITLLLAGGNYTYTFQNVTTSFFPTQFTLNQPFNVFGCVFTSPFGSLLNYSMNLLAQNGTNQTFNNIFNASVTGIPNGGTLQVNTTASNRSAFILTCNFTNINGVFYSNSYNYSVGFFTSSNIGLDQSLSILQTQNSWLVQIGLILVALVITFLIGGSNVLVGVVSGLSVLGYFTVLGFFSPLIFGITALVGVFITYRYIGGV